MLNLRWMLLSLLTALTLPWVLGLFVPAPYPWREMLISSVLLVFLRIKVDVMRSGRIVAQPGPRVMLALASSVIRMLIFLVVVIFVFRLDILRPNVFFLGSLGGYFACLALEILGLHFSAGETATKNHE